MARLVVHPGSQLEWEAQLQTGANSVGRRDGNDITIPDASISGSHCQIIVDGDSATIQDLGSTNGTFVNQAQVQTAVLKTGTSFRLGNVELVFAADGAGQTVAAGGRGPGLQLSPAAPQVAAAEALRSAPPPVPTGPAAAPPGGKCKHHPKTLGRYYCPQCRHYFCEVCVGIRSTGGVPHKICRHCGIECGPVEVRYEPVVEKGFFARLPGAFGYPLRGAGVLLVFVGIVLFAMINWGLACLHFRSLRIMGFGITLLIFAGGYLFTYLQNIVHSTAAEEREMPDLLGVTNFVEDVIVPFFRLLGLMLACFGPALGCLIWFLVTAERSAALASLGALFFGYVYFPMAFLAIAVLDSFAAINPLLVVPSIIKVPIEYLVSLVLLASAFAFRWAGDLLIDKLFPESWSTRSMATLMALLASIMFVSFVTLYLLVTAVHLLGIVFVTKKRQLGWLGQVSA